MKSYNDYANTIRGYLKNFKQLEAEADNLLLAIEGKEQELASVGAAIAKYGDSPGGGTDTLSPTERAAEARIKVENDIRIKAANEQNIRRRLKMLDNALCALNPEDAILLREHYMHGRSWRDIADETYTTEKAASIKAKRAIVKIAVMMFGSKADEQQGPFRFAEL